MARVSDWYATRADEDTTGYVTVTLQLLVDIPSGDLDVNMGGLKYRDIAIAEGHSQRLASAVGDAAIIEADDVAALLAGECIVHQQVAYMPSSLGNPARSAAASDFHAKAAPIISAEWLEKWRYWRARGVRA